MASYQQEMPPKGGYDFIQYAKKHKPRSISGKVMFLGFTAWTVVAYQIFAWGRRRYVLRPELENRDANIALEPLMQAERNRLFLKRLVLNRDYEADIMKDVKGWIPGTYYGSPVYHNKDVWMDPSAEEFWVHSEYDGYRKGMEERLSH